MSKEHVHTWKIASPNGEFSTGECECGEKRRFRNSKSENREGMKNTWNVRRAFKPAMKVYR